MKTTPYFDIVVDDDDHGAVAGISIEHASTAIDLTTAAIHDLPNVHIISGAHQSQQSVA